MDGWNLLFQLVSNARKDNGYHSGAGTKRNMYTEACLSGILGFIILVQKLDMSLDYRFWIDFLPVKM